MLLKEIESINYIKKSRMTFNNLYSYWKIGVKHNSFTTVGKIGSFSIHFMSYKDWEDIRMFYGLFDTIKKKYAMFVEVGKFTEKSEALVVHLTGVEPLYQGLGLPVKLYAWLILKRNRILVSGWEQTPGGRSIWERLATVPNIFMFGYDSARNKSFQIDQKDLFDEDIYTDALEQELKELENEYNLVDHEMSRMDDNTQEYRKMNKKLDDLENKIDKLNTAKSKAEDLVLVAIKKTKR